MTYEELIKAVAAWVNDPQIEPSIPTFVALAEAQINRRLGEAGINGGAVRATCTIDAAYSRLPSDFARPTSVTLVATGKAVAIISQESFQALLDRGVPSPAAPDHVCIVAGQMRFHPVPDAAYAVELVYQARVAGLSEANGANWVLADHPDVYLYGTLLQSAPFLGEDGRLATWGGLYAQALEGMIEAERAKEGSRLTPGFRPNFPQRRDTLLNGGVDAG